MLTPMTATTNTMARAIAPVTGAMLPAVAPLRAAAPGAGYDRGHPAESLRQPAHFALTDPLP